eukprot:NODE_282_length_10822_cov_1.088035.p1 type:complete len:642 gc:universal NODE_282_length_10822_cov_1.088035:7077-9002(+)
MSKVKSNQNTIGFLPSSLLNELSADDKSIALSSSESEINNRKRTLISSDDEEDVSKSRKIDNLYESEEDSVIQRRKSLQSDLLYQNDGLRNQNQKKVIFSDSEDELNEVGDILSDMPIDITDFVHSAGLDTVQSLTPEMPDESKIELELVKMFNVLPEQELCDLANISSVQFSKIKETRPFDSYETLDNSLKELKMSKAMRYSEQMIVLLNDMDDLLRKVESVNLETKHVPNIEFPLEIKTFIKPYQIEGASWMFNTYIQGLGCILGDEMGLGKSLQTILFLTFLKAHKVKPNIVIVPLSTLKNWERELTRWNPDLSYAIYHGGIDERAMFDLEVFKQVDIVLTTYNMACGKSEDRKFLRKLKPKAVILDEGHQVKNCATLKYKQLLEIPCHSKILLTGTPINNNLKEIISLLAFIVPSIFENYFQSLNTLLHLPNENASDLIKKRVDRASLLLKPFLLRRYKKDYIIDLPKKEIFNTFLDLSKKQRELYDNHNVEFDDVNFQAQTHDLRKICLHPLMILNQFKPRINEICKTSLQLGEYRKFKLDQLKDHFGSMSDFELDQKFHNLSVFKPYRLPLSLYLKNSCKFTYLKENLPKWIAQGDKMLIFSQYLSALDLLQILLDHLDIVLIFNLGICDVRWQH